MNVLITTKRLQTSLADVAERIEKGVRFTVIYRNRPVFQIVPVHKAGHSPLDLANDALYQAPAVGRSRDGRTASEHDTVLHRL